MTAAKEIDLSQFDGHTPGPWVARKEYHCEKCEAANENFTFVVRDANSEELARFSQFDEFADQSNSRAMAAFPTLLAELRQLREQNKAMAEALRLAKMGFESFEQNALLPNILRETCNNIGRELRVILASEVAK